jgi:hypothetical protein
MVNLLSLGSAIHRGILPRQLLATRDAMEIIHPSSASRDVFEVKWQVQPEPAI